MKKKIFIGGIIVVLALFLIPVPSYYKDGGTIRYHAVLYSVTNYHSLKSDGGFYTGIEVTVLGISIYDNTNFDE